MSQKHREQAIVRAYANQDAIDMISDDDWDEYEARLIQGSSSGTTPTSSKQKAQSPNKSSPHKRKREDEGTSRPSDSDERAPKRPRRSDEGKSGKPFKTKMASRTDPGPIDVSVAPKDITDIDADSDSDADDSTYGTGTHSVVNQAHVGSSSPSRGECAIKPIEIHASAALSRLSGSSSSRGRKRPSKLGASVGVIDLDIPKTPLPLPLSLPLRLSAQTPLPIPASLPAAVKEADGVEENVSPPPPSAAAAKPKKGKSAAGGSKLKLIRPEKKKTKKELEAEKKALELREKKMTRHDFIQYLYEEKLKEELLENAPLKKLVLKDKVIWYAEPGNAKAFDSFDRRRYEMVCVPRFVFHVPCSVLLFARPPALCSPCSPARPQWGHRCAGL